MAFELPKVDQHCIWLMNIINYLKWNLFSKFVKCIWVKKKKKKGLTSKSQVLEYEKDPWTLKDPRKTLPSLPYPEHITKNQEPWLMVFIMLCLLLMVVNFPFKNLYQLFLLLKMVLFGLHCLRAGHFVSFCFLRELKSG